LLRCVKNENVSTVLLGATKTGQLTENLGALEVAEKMTKEDLLEIDKILDNVPELYGGYAGNSMYRPIKTLEQSKR
jgi:aryl-alcohol dehydrogenase-like predicted oxidoreductase